MTITNTMRTDLGIALNKAGVYVPPPEGAAMLFEDGSAMLFEDGTPMEFEDA